MGEIERCVTIVHCGSGFAFKIFCQWKHGNFYILVEQPAFIVRVNAEETFPFMAAYHIHDEI